MHRYHVTIYGQTYEVSFDWLHPDQDHIQVLVDGEPVEVVLPKLEDGSHGLDWVMVDGHPYEITYDRDLRWIRDFHGQHSVEVRDLNVGDARPQTGNGEIYSPIPGQITHIFVTAGQEVAAGEALLVLEAMKMQNEIRSPRAGRVQVLHVAAGDGVGRGQLLAIVE